MIRRAIRIFTAVALMLSSANLGAQTANKKSTSTAGRDPAGQKLVAHWPLHVNGKDASKPSSNAAVRGLVFEDGTLPSGTKTVARFNGRDSEIEVRGENTPRLGSKEFTLSTWLQVDSELDDLPGDVLSQYDAASRRGFHLAVKTNSGVTFSQANTRQLQFAIDDDQCEATWTDCGRPGNALLAFSMAVHNGQLYVGTCEPGRDETGRVYRYEAPDRWIDCGALDRSNSVTSMVEFNGHLYAGTGKYRVAGSALPESENTETGGRVFRYEGGNQWTDCGALPNCEAVGGMAIYRGRLYASSLYRPAGFYRFEPPNQWIDCSVPVRPEDLPGEPATMRVEALGVFNGSLYATSYDGGRVFRYDGQSWHDFGQLGAPMQNTQTYAFAVRQSQLLCGTWPTGRVYLRDKADRWNDLGRLGEELEVMGMIVHNGRLIAGTLPSAEVYEFRSDGNWKRLAQLDQTPNVKYRRAWTMAEYGGRLFCSVLPTGRIYSWQAGRIAMSDRSLDDGWHHVIASRTKERLELRVDGELVGTSAPFNGVEYNLDSDRPLYVGAGPNDHFLGRLSDLKIYQSENH
ncbi:MAG: hypothetical protein RIS70_3992 [Planctomycetota bacterium]